MEKEKLLLSTKIQINLTDIMKTGRSWEKKNTILYTSTYTKGKNGRPNMVVQVKIVVISGEYRLEQNPKETSVMQKKNYLYCGPGSNYTHINM